MMSLEFNQNEDLNKLAVSALKNRLRKIYAGGGKKAEEKQKAKGKMLARERIKYLLDDNRPWIEIGALAALDMYESQGGCPSAGVVTGIGYVSGRQCVVVANDPTVKAGAWFPMTVKKNLRAQEVAMENRLPIIYLVDSAGVYLPMQEDIFPDKEHFGRVFRNNARMSSEGVVQIAAIMGACVAGGAYLPIMSDEAMIVEGTGSVFLAGSYLVRSAIGETIDNESLGGAETHCEISGVTDYKQPNDKACLDSIRKIVGMLGKPKDAGYDRIKSGPPKLDDQEIYGILPASREKPYNMKEIILRLVDHSEFEEYKALYGKSIICGLARIDGWAVGLVANQREVIKNKKGEMQIGGVIYSDAADKATRFIMNCNQKKIPLVFLQDVTGFMVGSRAEKGGIIKDGAKMVNAVANSVVPKITIVIGNSYGAGNYAMCGKAFDPRLIYAWPSARIAVMGGAQAARTLLQMEKNSRVAKGTEMDSKEEASLLREITEQYDEQTTPYYGAARLWIDGIIDPLDTRAVISTGIEAANQSPIEKPFNVGVIQT